MPEEAIVKTLKQFRTGEIDILVATTIIENGLDLPNANTLIVADGTLLGLSQAHQLRGRIGRSHHKAYAYFLYPADELTKTAQDRLDVLVRYAKLGDGFQIALEDLRLRGAGSIVGKKQSGHVNSVGFHLYVEMLNNALGELSFNE
jgi:transcription-repair coupling factor (superfamily II helicase)